MDILNKKTPYGSVNITKEAISNLVGDIVCSTYGIGGIASCKKKDNYKLIKNDENFKDGILISKDKNSYTINIHLYVVYPLKLTEIVSEVQKRVKYSLSKKFSLNFKTINIYVDGLLMDQSN